ALTEVPGTVIGRYKLLEQIGEGGMAVVYMAEQQEPIRRKVALKIIKLGMDTKSVIARFEAERQALAMMDHPNIANVLDAGATDMGRPYFVMDVVKGTSITEFCDNNKLSTRERLELFIQVCHAVQHAHENGIIHRDIKPTNVMVTLHDGRATPKVIDFGIAKATSQRLREKTLFTRYAQMIGTPAYMSPEQAQFCDSEIDMRTDIYSLGVLLYELLIGATPFSEDELRKAGYLEMQRIICEEVPVKPSTKLSTLDETLTDVAEHRNVAPESLRKLIRGDLDWIVMKALEKDRTRRYESSHELASDIKRHLADEPVLAGPPSVGYRLHKFVRRNRLAVGIVILVVGATLMGATAAKLGILTFPGSSGSPQHASGMVQRHVWNAPSGSSLCGGISPDGRYLSYTDWAAGNLAARDLITETSWLVTTNTDSTWKTIDGWADTSIVSPDGTQIAYSWHNEKGLNFYDLRITDLDGSNIRVLYSNPAIFYIFPFAWSPDGEEILACLSDKKKSLVDEQSDEMGIKLHFILVAVADGSVRTLKTWYKYDYPRAAFFSPDGNYIAFEFEQEDVQDNYDIYLIGRDGSGEIPLIQHAADERLLGWAPDSHKVVLISDRTAERGLWMINVPNGIPEGPAVLLKGMFDGQPIGFTADGSYYYAVDTTARNVYVAGLDDTGAEIENPPRLVSSRFVGSTMIGVWSPDGRFLAYRRQDANTRDWTFVICSMDTFQERVITPSPPFRAAKIMRGPSFSPDGRSLLVCGDAHEGGFRLYTINVETGAVAPIADNHPGQLKRAVWSPDGQSIYIRRGTRLSRLDPTTGEETSLQQGLWTPTGLDISPDGQWLAFYVDRDTKTMLAVMPSAGGEFREVVQLEQKEMFPHAFVTWTPDGEHLLFCKNKRELWRVHVATGAQQHITTMNGELLSAEVHPDGRQIAFTVQQAGSQLWVMENFLPEQ
ncbi:protein kinase, partial [Planctomycetota bacterium]